MTPLQHRQPREYIPILGPWMLVDSWKLIVDCRVDSKQIKTCLETHKQAPDFLCIYLLCSLGSHNLLSWHWWLRSLPNRYLWRRHSLNNNVHAGKSSHLLTVCLNFYGYRRLLRLKFSRGDGKIWNQRPLNCEADLTHWFQLQRNISTRAVMWWESNTVGLENNIWGKWCNRTLRCWPWKEIKSSYCTYSQGSNALQSSKQSSSLPKNHDDSVTVRIFSLLIAGLLACWEQSMPP